MNDGENKKSNFFIYDYFFVKVIDKVRNRGIINFVIFSGTIDKKYENIRHYIVTRLEFL